MRIYLSLFILVYCSGALFGQTVHKQVIASGGNTVSNGENAITATIGESIIGNRGTTVTIGQGFLAGIPSSSTLSVTQVFHNQEIQLYPNPVHDLLTISLKNLQQPLITSIFSATGQKVATYDLSSDLFTIPMENMSSGIYLIQLHFKNSNTIKTFKIIKK